MGAVKVIRDEDGNEVGTEKVEAEEKGRAFRYLNAAMACQDRFRDSHVAMLVLRSLAHHADYKTGVSMPGYDTLMYESGTCSRTLVADILRRFELLGILTKKKRMNNSTVYTLSLTRMHELRKPFLKPFQAQVIDRMNEVAIAWVPGVEETKLTQDALLIVNDDRYVFEVLNWWLDQEEDQVIKKVWFNWLDQKYPVIRSAYFKERLLEDEPELAPFRTLDLSHTCDYCHEIHLGSAGCSPEAIAQVKKDKKKKAPKESAITFENDADDYVDDDLVGDNFDLEEV
jgi:hypothetical protein